MSITVYFGKVNLISEHIYKIYSGELEIREILNDILVNFQHGMRHQEENIYIGEDGQQHSNIIKYSVYIREKTDTYIRGRVDKESKLVYKEKDPITEELLSKTIANTDAVEFYFDVFREMVGYNTSFRFGHKKFLEIFSIMLNQAAKNAGKEYYFEVDRYTNGIDINNLYEELKKVEGIQKLTFTYKPVNPDTELLNSIINNGKDRLAEYEEANLSSKSILFTSTSKLGLNINSDLIKESMNEVDNLQRDLSAKKATKNGYIKVEVIGKDGITRSTENAAPIKRTIHKITELAKACEDVIRKHVL